MKRIALLLLLPALAALTLSSCKKDSGNEPTYSYVSLETGDAAEISPISGKVTGNIVVRNVAAGRMYGYFFYSDKPLSRLEMRDQGIRTKNDTLAIQDCKYGIVIDGLKPNTTYYYVAALSIHGVSLLDEVRNFTTPDFCQTRIATDTTSTSITLNAAAYLSDAQKGEYEYGFEYTATDFVEAVTVMASAPGADNLFHAAVTGLTPNTKYYFRAFTRKDAIRTPANVLTFKTKE
ncbi:MAG: fibronectin type III domain-containing protein [Bacteroidales bacterium]|nr:fibronectin type III domain-containing protein [Bacteroidales bacterium]